jgi:hypothetical protein
MYELSTIHTSDGYECVTTIFNQFDFVLMTDVDYICLRIYFAEECASWPSIFRIPHISSSIKRRHDCRRLFWRVKPRSETQLRAVQPCLFSTFSGLECPGLIIFSWFPDKGSSCSWISEIKLRRRLNSAHCFLIPRASLPPKINVCFLFVDITYLQISC